MFKSFRNATITIIATALLGGGCLALALLYMNETEHTQQLERRLTELDKQVKRADIDKSINQQMEEIADGQSIIAKQQAEKAEENAKEAQKQAEIAEENAKEAQKQAEIAKQERDNATASEAKARDEQKKAEDARRDADVQRTKAEHMSYLALGRSLGAMAYNQHQSGDKVLAAQLAYASYWLTDSFKTNASDLYHISVMQGLMEASEGLRTWNRIHRGGITGICFKPQSDSELVTVSSYGEIYRHEVQGDNLTTTKLFENNTYDFRSVYLDEEGTIFAASYFGQLVVIKPNGKTAVTVLTGIEHPSSLENFDSEVLIVVGERSVALFNTKTLKQQGEIAFDHRLTASGRLNHHPLLFDERGNMYEMTGLVKPAPRKIPARIKGAITAFARSDKKEINTYGTSDGKIYLEDRNGNVKELVGHRSRVSRLKVNGNQLYSSSYDGKMNLWLYEDEKAEPIQLFESEELDAWIRYYTVDNAKIHVWTGDNNGNITRILINIRRMVDKLRTYKALTRDQWDNYVGKNAPYDDYVRSVKGGMR